MLFIKSVLSKDKNHYYYNIFSEKSLYQLAKEIIKKNYFYSIIILRYGEKRIAKEKFYTAKKLIKIWDVNVDNIVISKLVKTKN